MFKSEIIAEAYKNCLGWRQHHDTNEFSIDNALTVTETGEYYQQKHPALRLDIIRSIVPDNMTLDYYLAEKVRDGSVEMLNDLFQYRQMNKYGKTLLKETQLLNKYGWVNDKIINEGRFVGFQIRLKTATGLMAVIKQIGVQFSGVDTFKLYVFHTSQKAPISEIDITTTGGAEWNWQEADIELASFEERFNGGAFVIGYYQDDLTGHAINNTDFNFDRGACGGCNKTHYSEWRNVSEYFTVYPLYVPTGSFAPGEMFDLQDAFYIPTQTFGLNLRLSTVCDLTTFFKQNKFAFKNLLGLKVTELILNDMKYSQEINYIEENIKMMVIRDLEGDTETKMNNITRKYHKELMAVNFNVSGINQKCLPCEGEAYEPEYGFV